MSYKSGKWTNGKAHGGPYSHSGHADLHKASLGYSLDEANRGVMLGYGNDLAVTASSPAAKSVDIDTGAAVVAGYIFSNSASATLAAGDNTSGYTRVDRVVLRADFTLGKVEPAIIAGPEDGSGAPAALVRSASYYDIPVALITVASGFTTIADTDIEPDHYYANLPPVLAPTFTNVSGGELEIGAVAVLGTTTGTFTTTTAQGGRDFAGVLMERTAHNATGKLARAGRVLVQCDAAVVAVGDPLQTSATAGKATPGWGNAFGMAVSSKSGGAGYVEAMLFAYQPRNLPYLAHLGGNYTTLVGSWVDVGVPVYLIPNEIKRASEVYFRAQLSINNGAYTCQARLLADGVTVVTLSTSATAPTTVESANIVSVIAAGSSPVSFKVQALGDASSHGQIWGSVLEVRW